MSDLLKQIQQHYEGKSLPAAKAEAILAAARAATAGGEEKIVDLSSRRKTIWRVAWAIAASFAVLAGIATWLWPHGRGPVSYALFAPRIVQFMGTPPELPKRSQNPQELRAWLMAQGAPADFQIPAKLSALKSFGCQVVDVHGRPAYLTCFWTEKKPGVDDGSLVHLLVAHRKDFRDLPPENAPQFRTLNGWSFAAWTSGDVVYTMAAAAPLDQLRKFIANAAGISIQAIAVR